MTTSSGLHHTVYASAMGPVRIVLLMTRARLYADIVCKEDSKRDQGGRVLSSTGLKSGHLIQWRRLAEVLEDPPLNTYTPPGCQHLGISGGSLYWDRYVGQVEGHTALDEPGNGADFSGP